MKVLLIDQIASVNYKYTFSLCNELKRQGVDIEIIIDNKESLDECDVNSIKMFNTGDKSIGKVSKLLNYVNSLRKILFKIKKEKYEVLHVQWFTLTFIDYWFLKKVKSMGIKVVVTIHDILPFKDRFYEFKFHKKIYDLVDEIIVQAEGNVKRFNELFPQDSHKVAYIPHGNFVNYSDIYDMEEAKKYLGLEKYENIFLFFGQIKKVKGLGILIDSFAEVVKKRDDVYLVIAGSVSDDEFEQYEKKIKEYNIQDKVRCDIKYIDDDEVGYYYSSCILNVLPYLDVYQSGVIQLSYAHKKPVVATNLPAFTCIVKEGINGFIAEVNDSHSLTEALLRALDKIDILKNMGEEGYKFINEQYSWNDIGKKVKNIYYK